MSGAARTILAQKDTERSRAFGFICVDLCSSVVPVVF
jgi:hypothetical protein